MQTEDPGFRVLPDVLRDEDFSRITTLLDSSDRSRAGRRHLLHNESVRRLSQDPQLVGLAADLIGGQPAPFTATLFDKSADSNWLVVWHQDVALPVRSRLDAKGWGPWSVKSGQLYAHAPTNVLEQVVALRIHLDDSTSDNGPLRVLPGTHILGRLSEDQIRQLAQDIQPVECLVGAGGVVALRLLTVHASSKSRSQMPRRVLHIEYATGVDLGAGIRLAIA
jgi:hypothetical protein